MMNKPKKEILYRDGKNYHPAPMDARPVRTSTTQPGRKAPGNYARVRKRVNAEDFACLYVQAEPHRVWVYVEGKDGSGMVGMRLQRAVEQGFVFVETNVDFAGERFRMMLAPRNSRVRITIGN